MFDCLGNYLYCQACILKAFAISKQRLARLRKAKRDSSQEPVVEMTKQEVEGRRLGDFVVMPPHHDTAFSQWWKGISASTIVDVRYPYGIHGNAGKVSNSAKTSVLDDFLTFVDVNSQPNGRSADSTGPTHYFLPIFTTLQTPKVGVSHYQERVRRSVVGEFNRAQTECGRGTCSNGSCHNWIKKYRPKVGICPDQDDYCDTCAKSKEGIRGKQTAINRLRASASSDPSDIQGLEDEMKSMKEALEVHRQESKDAHKYFVDVTKKCSEEWKEISELEAKLPHLSSDEEEKLAVLKHKFNLVLSADYQMGKLIPNWGQSAQPGSTYYLQKLHHDILGIVNHASGSSAVYLFDERAGPKNTDHTISYLTHYSAPFQSGCAESIFSWIIRVVRTKTST